jgi:hypothetical protein
MISLAFTKVGHRFIRQIRFRHILSGGHDNTPFEAADARQGNHSNPPDASTLFEAGPALVESGGFDCMCGGHVDRDRCEEKTVRTPPARQRTPHSPCFCLLFSLFFSQLSSASALATLILKSCFFDSESIS